VHYEAFRYVRAAIAREKEIKGWRREKKIRLIESGNRTWEDRAADGFTNAHGMKTKPASPEISTKSDCTSATRATVEKTKADPSPSKLRPDSG
jgi:hypothetical protein